MKKIMLFVLILLMALSGTYSNTPVSDTATFYLKAYKNNVTDDNPTLLYITDAITTDSSSYETNLGYLGDERKELNLTSDLSELLGDLTREDPEIVVFSYRVESKEAGSFELGLSASGPFTNDTTNASIDFEWALRNVTFSTNGSAVLKEQGYWQEGDYWWDDDEWIKTYDAETLDAGPKQNGAELKNTWYVENTNNDIWYKRGGVALLIDRSGYENSKTYGRYQTKVTVTLTKN